MAWDPRGDGRLLLHAAYGVYYDDIISAGVAIAPLFYVDKTNEVKDRDEARLRFAADPPHGAKLGLPFIGSACHLTVSSPSTILRDGGVCDPAIERTRVDASLGGRRRSNLRGLGANARGSDVLLHREQRLSDAQGGLTSFGENEPRYAGTGRQLLRLL
jgi:hypothetical protein